MQLTGLFRITGKLKETNAAFFRDLRVGDMLVMSMPITKIRRIGNRLHATTIKVISVSSGNTINLSITELVNRLECFELVEANSNNALQVMAFDDGFKKGYKKGREEKEAESA